MSGNKKSLQDVVERIRVLARCDTLFSRLFEMWRPVIGTDRRLLDVRWQVECDDETAKISELISLLLTELTRAEDRVDVLLDCVYGTEIDPNPNRSPEILPARLPQTPDMLRLWAEFVKFAAEEMARR